MIQFLLSVLLVVGSTNSLPRATSPTQIRYSSNGRAFLPQTPTSLSVCPPSGRLLSIQPIVARAVVELVAGSDSQVSGHLEITQIGGDQPALMVTGRMQGLSAGLHGFHVHMNGELTNQCKDAGGHFNPDMNNHGAPNSLNRHAGDLGNILASPAGFATVNICDRVITLGDGGKNDIAGRAIVVHETADDLGQGGNDGSLSTGNAGSRLACGVIKLQ